jgi:hypothetical protein
MKNIVSVLHSGLHNPKRFVSSGYRVSVKRIGRLSGLLQKTGAGAVRKFMKPHAPDFMIVGAHKSGTSSLHYYLHQHPDLCGSTPKELHFFNRHTHLGVSLAEYESNFKSLRAKMHFESTPAYLYQPGALELIRKTYPGIRLIVILRDPVKRAYSAWNQYRQSFGHSGVEQYRRDTVTRPGHQMYAKLYEGRTAFPSLRECIDIELAMIRNGEGFEPSVLRRGLYHAQLQNCWKLFGKDRVLILGFADLIKDTPGTLDKVIAFIGARSVDWSFLSPEPRNARDYPVPLQAADQVALEEFYREPNRRLFEEVGRLNW